MIQGEFSTISHAPSIVIAIRRRVIHGARGRISQVAP
jgi:hypothetical protein